MLYRDYSHAEVGIPSPDLDLGVCVNEHDSPCRGLVKVQHELVEVRQGLVEVGHRLTTAATEVDRRGCLVTLGRDSSIGDACEGNQG